MKFNKVAALCKQSRTITIYNTADESGMQWLGDNVGMYLLEGMPRLCAESALRLLDVPEGKYADYICHERDLPEDTDFSDAAGVIGEELEPYGLSVNREGCSYLLFRGKTEMYAVNEKYLAPFVRDAKYLRCHSRKAKGSNLLGINVGLRLKAIIAPAKLHTDEGFTRELAEVAQALRAGRC